MIIDIIKLISSEGLAITIAGFSIFFAFRYFRMKEKDHELRYQKTKQILNAKITEKLVSYCVWYYSRTKLQMIKTVLVANDIKERHDEIKLKIKNSLERISLFYVE